jgi:hypothetical protein
MSTSTGTSGINKDSAMMIRTLNGHCEVKEALQEWVQT